ncbi:MOSC domain-containing protein [Granulicella mallensis]|uniref:MOSC domain-containing protein YiiM n=1 Tax=Granulicella mallensis TaxID=940614 RepID=A0A7W8E882_9BACT|nr:MOSC domain-containing protein [Granulicella mallensis]MBB5062371.1 MOSC domain-containing protein YiiM [Granulicella mallensis]
MIAEIVSVNISSLQKMWWNGQEILTGIHKSAVSHPVQVETLSIVGDSQADLVNHGGKDKAVYFYPSEHFPFWAEVLGKPQLHPGDLGENFTSKGVLETDVFIGDTWRVGTALVQITQPRSPCYKLAIKHERADLVTRFLEATKPGFYASVLREGVVRAGDSMELVSREQDQITVADVFRLAVGFEPEVKLRSAIRDYDLIPEFWRKKVRAHGPAVESIALAS